MGDLKAEEPEAESSGLDTSPPPPRDPPVTLNADLAASPEAGTFTTATDPPDFTGASPTSPRKSCDTTGRRLSSHSARTDFYYPYGRQRVKLGPRPSTDTSGRPRTSSANLRAVSTIPAGFKLFSKGSRKGKSSDAADDESIAESQVEIPDIAFAAPNLPISTEPLSPGLERPHTSSGASFTMAGSKAAAPAKEKITPEKARLMKAMQLREKKKKMSMLPPPSPSESQFASEAGEAKEEEAKPADGAPEEEAKDGSTEEAKDHLAPEDAAIPLSTADSVIAMEASAAAINDQASDATQSDSHPASPFIASSEAEQSTKASSLSESTDETVQGRDSVVKDDEEPAKVDGDEPAETDAGTPRPDTVEAEQPVDALADVHEAPVMPPATVEEVPSEVKGSDEQVEPELEATEPQADVALPESKPSTAPNTVEEPAAPEDTAKEPTVPENTVEESAAPESDAVPEPKATEEAKAPLRVPRSKFSTPDLRVVANNQEPPVPAIPTADGDGEAAKSTDDTTRETKDADSTPADTKADRQATHLNPIRTDLTVPSASSSQHLSVDDELLDELQSAVVEEAKPVAVSPRSPVFPPIAGAKEGAAMASSNRAVSQPSKPTLLSPTDIPLPTGRSSSSGTTFLNRLSQSQASNAPAPKKANMGSTISQRIKALEKLSGSEGEPRPAAPTARLFTTKKSSREPSRSPSVVERASSFTRNSPPPGLGEGSPDTLRQPTRDRSGSLKNRLSMFETGVSPPRGRTESVQVRAKIVRDPSQPHGAGRRDSTGPLDLKQSPLVVDHQRSEPTAESTPPPPPKETIQERRMSNQTRRSESHDGDDTEGKRRSSLNFMRDFIKDRRMSLTSPSVDSLMSPRPVTPSQSPSRPPSTHQSSSLTRRLSISSRRSSVSRDAAPAMSPSAFTETSGSGDDAKSEKRSKSRTGRFMRRLSSSLSSGRSKSTTTGISPTLHEEVSSEAVGPPRVAAFMGDVNVQFPDNLLWKRRCMCLDSQGFLVLSTAATAGSRAGAAAGVKKYHLSEFRAPYAPEMEVQELPNSVCLDFVEGSGLQVACEDRAGQTSVLQSESSHPVLVVCLWLCVLTDALQLFWMLTGATHLEGNNLVNRLFFVVFTAAISLFLPTTHLITVNYTHPLTINPLSTCSHLFTTGGIQKLRPRPNQQLTIPPFHLIITL